MVPRARDELARALTSVMACVATSNWLAPGPPMTVQFTADDPDESHHQRWSANGLAGWEPGVVAAPDLVISDDGGQILAWMLGAAAPPADVRFAAHGGPEVHLLPSSAELARAHEGGRGYIGAHLDVVADALDHPFGPQTATYHVRDGRFVAVATPVGQIDTLQIGGRLVALAGVLVGALPYREATDALVLKGDLLQLGFLMGLVEPASDATGNLASLRRTTFLALAATERLAALRRLLSSAPAPSPRI